jgi:hypothetical protein
MLLKSNARLPIETSSGMAPGLSRTLVSASSLSTSRRQIGSDLLKKTDRPSRDQIGTESASGAEVRRRR